MLHDFLASHRSVLIDRCRLMVANRASPPATEAELVNGIPTFFDQLIETLRIEQTSERARSPEISGVPGGGTLSQIGNIATLHGRELLRQGYSLEQVVRDYGDVCQAVTNLAYELSAPIEVDEFRTFNRCIDNAIASAVNAYALQQAATAERDYVVASNTRMGSLIHELRNYLHVVTYAVRAIRAGNIGVDGATAAVLDRSLSGMRSLIDRSVAEVRLTADLPARIVPIPVAAFVTEAVAAASLELQSHECLLTVMPVEADLVVNADPDMLHAAVFNLLKNAFKFTRHKTVVTLQAHASAERVLIEVADHCGGLPPGAVERLLQPFQQTGEDRSGLGLGLDICRRGVEASNGTLRVRDVPGSGCVFTIDLPRHASTANSREAVETPRIEAR